MRTFVAVELNDACRSALARAVEALRADARGVRWVRPEAQHLTLKFIGELDELDVPRAIECLTPACAAAAPFTMKVSGLSAFPSRGTPRVIHVEVQEPTGTLNALQVAVEKALAEELGIARERRSYVAHITLGRVRDRRQCPTIDEIAAVVCDQDFGCVAVDSMVLMKSDLRPTGAVYTPLRRFLLGS